MDLVARLGQLAEEAVAKKAEKLAEDDMGWWVKKIRAWVKKGKAHGRHTDVYRMFFKRHSRLNRFYAGKLGALLGEPFKVEVSTDWFYDGAYDYRKVPCIAVSW